MSQRTQHLSDEALVLTIDDELSPARRASIDAHLQECASCRMRFHALVSAAERSRVAPDEIASGASETMRARLVADLTVLSRQLDRSWRFRLARIFATVPNAVVVGAAVVAIALVLAEWPKWRIRRDPGRLASTVALVEPDALPVRAFTPGATRQTSVHELCAGSSPQERTIPVSVRQAVLRDYRMEDVPEDEYELDYLITPELAGATDRRNLWPERYAARVWNAKVKDELERLLPRLVCEGRVDLKTAQDDIAADWVAAYKKYFHTNRPIDPRARKGVGTQILALAQSDALVGYWVSGFQ